MADYDDEEEDYLEEVEEEARPNPLSSSNCANSLHSDIPAIKYIILTYNTLCVSIYINLEGEVSRTPLEGEGTPLFLDLGSPPLLSSIALLSIENILLIFNILIYYIL